MSEINRSDAKRGDVLITITYPQSGGGATLRIEDQMSGTHLIRVDLTPKQYMDMLRSTGVAVSGARLPARPELIGRRMENTHTDIRHSHVDIDAAAERERDQYLADGWAQVSIDKTNFGRRVRAYRWVTEEKG